MTPTAPGTPTSPHPSSGPARAFHPAEFRRKAHAKLAERIDLVRSRFKPLSLLRAEARRVLESLCDQDVATLSRGDRDRLIEDYLAESVGFGPLEELFRDDAVKEILVVAAGQVIARKADVWSPTSARFRDAEQLRSTLSRWVEVGEPLVAPAGPVAPGAGPTAGFDVRLANGFRVLAILPPLIMELSPQAHLTRHAAPAPVAAGGSAGSGLSGGSSVFTRTARPDVRGSNGMGAPLSSSESGFMPRPALTTPAPVGPSGPPSGTQLAAPAPVPDVNAKIRQRVTERIIVKFASAGVYDLNQIPLPELRRIVVAHVAEFCATEKLGADEAGYDRLALEILSGMNR